MINRSVFFLITFLFSASVFSQKTSGNSYIGIRKKYEKMDTDDEKALPFVRQYISKAKAEKNYEKWVQGYRDGVQFSKKVDKKMNYADSTIAVALRSKNAGLIANAYLGKGIVFYFNIKKFKPALDQYLIAQEYADQTDDGYLKNKVLYHIGVVKSYLGYYDEASEHFRQCLIYSEKQMEKEKNAETVYNYKKASFNSMHQLAVTYRHLNKFSEADSIIRKGLMMSDNADYQLEHAYFLKCRGILEYRKKNYNDGIYYFEKSLPKILERNDFAWASVIYYYLGNTYWINGDKEKALKNYRKVDSIFTVHQFILPEIRNTYASMIKYYEEQKDVKKELFYTKQLLKVDNMLQKDFAYLSSKIHREYDQKKLLGEKKKLEKSNLTGFRLMLFFIVLSIIFMGVLIINRKNKKEIARKYELLQQKFQQGKMKNNEESKEKRNTALPEDILSDISVKLKKFEDEGGFRLVGLTLHGLAKKLGTNSKYLSAYINDVKGVNFKTYINELRIGYIIKLLNEDDQCIKYTISAMGREVGFQYRQKFSDAFLKVTGIRPTDFIKQKKQENSNPPSS